MKRHICLLIVISMFLSSLIILLSCSDIGPLSQGKLVVRLYQDSLYLDSMATKKTYAIGDVVRYYTWVNYYRNIKELTVTHKACDNDTIVTVTKYGPFQTSMVPGFGFGTLLSNGTDTLIISGKDGTQLVERKYLLEVTGAPEKPQILNGKNILVLDAPILKSDLPLSVVARGSKPIFYSWFKNDTLCTTSNKNKYILKNLSPSHEGIWRCIASNVLGSDTSLPYLLYFKDTAQKAPSLLNQKNLITFGSNTKNSLFGFFVRAIGATPMQYKWYKDKAELQNQTKDTLIFSSLAIGDSGVYSCKVYNTFGSDQSVDYKLTVKDANQDPTKPVLSNSKMIQTHGVAQAESSLVLYVRAQGKAPVRYIWYKNGGMIKNGITDSIQFKPFLNSDTGIYFCIAENNYGADTSLPYTVKTTIPGSPKFVQDKPQSSYTIKEGDPLTFAFSATDPANKPLRFWIVSSTLPQNGNAVVLDTTKKELSWLSKIGDKGSYMVKIGVTNGQLGDTATVTVVIGATDLPPQFVKDKPQPSYTIKEGDPLSILFAATDPANKPLRFYLVSSTLPKNGNAVVFDTAKKELSWISKIGDNGNYLVKIGVTNGQLSDTAKVNVAVGATALPPQFVKDKPQSSYTIKEEDSLTIAFAATDPANKPLRYFLVSSTLPQNGNLVVFDTAKKEMSWVSKIGDKGSYLVKIGVTNGLLGDTASVNVLVGLNNKPPVITIKDVAASSVVTIEENKTLTLQVSATDPNGDAVVLAASNLPTGAVFAPATGICTYTPGFDLSSNAADKVFSNVTFSATDNGTPVLTSSVKISIQVKNVNREPTVKNFVSNNLKEKTPVSIDIDATDPDNDALSWTISTPLSSGTVDKKSGTIGTGAEFTYTSGTISGSAEETFSVDISDGAITKTALCTLRIIGKPEILAQPTDQSVPTGNTATFTVSVKKVLGQTYTFSWSKQYAKQKNTRRSNGTEDVYSIKADNTMNGNKYACTITNSAGLSVTSNPATLNVLWPPTIKTDPSAKTVNAGDAVSFTVAVNDGSPVKTNYKWYDKRDSLVSQEKEYSFTAQKVDNGQSFYCVVSNSAGSNKSKPAALTVQWKPVIGSDPANVSVIQGAYAQFSITMVDEGNPKSSYQWYSDNGADSGQTTLTFKKTTTKAMNGLQYWCVAKNSAGEVASKKAVLTVYYKGTLSISVTPDPVEVEKTITCEAILGAWNPPPQLTWSYGGETRTGNNVTFTAKKGQSTISCTADNGKDSSVISRKTIEIKPANVAPVIERKEGTVFATKGVETTIDKDTLLNIIDENPKTCKLIIIEREGGKYSANGDKLLVFTTVGSMSISVTFQVQDEGGMFSNELTTSIQLRNYK